MSGIRISEIENDDAKGKREPDEGANIADILRRKMQDQKLRSKAVSRIGKWEARCLRFSRLLFGSFR
jgi:hypothetical protein